MKLLASACILLISHSWTCQPHPVAKKRNVIFMVSDGTGLATHTMAHQYLNITQGIKRTVMDTILVGTSASSSASNLITDSGAGATAFSCGYTTINNYVGMTPDGRACGTVLEAAKVQGMATSLVVKSAITDATPAAFATHLQDRNQQDAIAAQLIGDGKLGRMVDLMFGGGKKYFLPQDKGGSRADARDLLQEAKTKGWTLVDTKQAFDELKGDAKLPLFGMFADGDMPYDVDRNAATTPSLEELTKKALDIMLTTTRHGKHGFFMMVEGSNLDKAAHQNDPVAHLREALEYYKTVQVVKDFCQQHPDTVMISVSDHETGGLALGRDTFVNGARVYPDWKVDVVQNATMSANTAAKKILDSGGDKAARKTFIEQEILTKAFGVKAFEAQDVEAMLTETDWNTMMEKLLVILNKYSNIGWTTHAHTSIDVPLYAFGKDISTLTGYHEHTDLNKFVVQYLGLDLKAITARLNQ